MSTVIDTLIYDRTAQDVLDDTDKAYCAYTDLNRIEQACSYISNELGITITTKDWLITDLRTEADMTRIKNNLSILREALNRSTTPAVPDTINFSSINQANTIEKMLYDINNFFENIIAGSPRLAYKLGTKTLGNKGV